MSSGRGWVEKDEQGNVTIHAPAAGTAASYKPPGAYLDTNLVIGLDEEDLAPTEMAAMYDFLQRQKEHQIRLCTSHVAREELERRSAGQNRVSRLIYMLLDDVPALNEQYRTADTLGSMASGTGPPIVIDSTLGKLNEILPGEDDARHIFQARRPGIDYFLTCDQDTILKHAQAVEAAAANPHRSPSQLVAELRGDASCT